MPPAPSSTSSLTSSGASPAPDLLAIQVLLRRTPVFQSFKDADFSALAAVLKRRALNPGDVLFSEGELGDSLFIVGEGALSVVVGAETVGQLQAGAVTGEAACIDPAPRSAAVRAETRATVFELSQSNLRVLQEQSPGVATALVGGIIAQISARLRDTQRRIDNALGGPTAVTISGVLPRVAQSNGAAEPVRPTPFKDPLDLSALRSARGLSDRDLEVLLAVAPPVRYPDQAILCEEGRPGSTCFLIARGAVDVVREVEGVQRMLAVLPAGALAGQVALVDHGTRSATLRARGEAVVLPLAREDFEKLLKARSPLALRFQEQVALAGVRQLRVATDRLATLLAKVAAAPPQRREAQRFKLAYLQTSVREWDMSPDGADPAASARRPAPRR